MLKMQENSQGGQCYKKEPCSKAAHTVFAVWLSLLGAVLIVGSLYPLRIAGQGAVRSFGMLIYGMLDILFMIIYATKNVYLMNKVTSVNTNKSSEEDCGKYAFRQLLVFLAGTLLYGIYCFVPGIFPRYSMVQDAFVMCAILCVAVWISERIKL